MENIEKALGFGMEDIVNKLNSNLNWLSKLYLAIIIIFVCIFILLLVIGLIHGFLESAVFKTYKKNKENFKEGDKKNFPEGKLNNFYEQTPQIGEDPVFYEKPYWDKK